MCFHLGDQLIYSHNVFSWFCFDVEGENNDVVYLFYSAHGWQLQSSLHMSFPPETRDARGLRE